MRTTTPGSRPSSDAARSAVCASAAPDLRLPGDEHAAGRKQRRRVLAENAQRRERSSRDEVVAREPIGPLLGSRIDDVGVFDAGVGAHPFEELALSRHALDQRDAGLWQGDGEREAREAGAGAEVGGDARAGDLWERERAQRVRDVNVEYGFGRDGARCEGVGNEQLDDALERRELSGVEAPTVTELRKPVSARGHPWDPGEERMRAM